MKNTDYQSKIIDEIKKYQGKDGSFKVSVIDKDLKKHGHSPSIFSTSVILGNLSTINNIDDTDFLTKSADFLTKQSSRKNTWNYWNNLSENFKILPYPDDIDDSALAVFAILQYGDISKNIELIRNSLFQINKQKDKKLGYKTWFVKKNANKHWFDFDPVVNSNVILLKSYLGINDDEKITQDLYKGLEEDSLLSKYYFNKIHVAYFIVRMLPKYKNKKITQRLVRFLKKENDILTLSMMLSTLIRLNSKEKVIRTLYKKIIGMEDQWYKVYPLHIESIQNGKINYAGSEALTLSFILEAINLYRNYLHEELNKERINKKIINISLAGFNSSTTVVKLLSESLEYILSWKSVRKIILLPSQITETKKTIPKKVVDKISAIGLLGWVAFTIDDHIRDGDKEIKTPWISISISNILKNRMYQLISEVTRNMKTYKMIEEMETYSVLEEINGNLNYGKMEHATKSIGLSIPTLLLFERRKNIKNYRKVLLECFKYYISARQISDDATDWKEDLKSGRLTYVTKLISPKINLKVFEKEFFPKITRRISKDCRKSINSSLEIFGTKINPLANISYEYIRTTRREMAQKLLN